MSSTLRRTLWLLPAFAGLALLARFGDASAKGKGDLWKEHDANEGTPAYPAVQLPSIAPLVKHLGPAVVNVYTTQLIRPGSGLHMSDDPAEEFWHRFMGPQQEVKRNSLGSGFIINPRGYIITNNHVVERATEIRIKLADDRGEFPGEVVGRDPKTDVALIRIKGDNAPKDLPFVYLGDSDKLEVGDFVVAIGNPFGLDHSVSLGIVSAKERVIGAGQYDDFIQTDAAINPGNSGGPMFNLKGEVVGINTAVAERAQGIGFAVPINLAKEVIPSLESNGSMTRGFLGVGIQEMTPELAKVLHVDRQGGALVKEVFPDSPAEKGGLKAGDVVTAVNGRDVRNINQLSRFVALVTPGQSAALTVLREGKEHKVSVKVAERPQDDQVNPTRSVPGPGNPGSPGPADRLGLSVQPMSPDLAHRFGINRREGLVVVDVDSDSPAEVAGVTPGSVILEVNRVPVRSAADYQRALAAAKPGDLVLLRLQRGDTASYVAVRVRS